MEGCDTQREEFYVHLLEISAFIHLQNCLSISRTVCLFPTPRYSMQSTDQVKPTYEVVTADQTLYLTQWLEEYTVCYQYYLFVEFDDPFLVI